MTDRFAVAAIDGYLLDGHPSKARAIEALLAARSDDQKAAPFYRALEMVGARAADEALIALRLVLAGVDSDDEHVKRLRGLVKTVRAGGSAADGARAAYAAEIRQSPDGGNR